MKRRIVAGIVAGILILTQISYQARAGNGDNTEAFPLAYADIWSTPATVKVLQTAQASDYDDVRTDHISLVSGKNEYESGQIIVSAKRDLSFTVRVSDLVDVTNGANRIGKENFRVYIQKYIEVTRNWHNNGAPTGNYPDAILPQENAVTYGQNAVKKGANGGAWLEFYIPETTSAGNYQGTATVTVGEAVQNIPVSLKVYDVTIPKDSSQKSLFTVNWQQVAVHEEDGSQEMVDKYNAFLMQYRCSPTGMEKIYPVSAEEFANRAYAWCKKGMSTIGLSVGNSTQVLDGFTVFDYEYVADRIAALARKSFETNYNLIEKAAFYNFYIDEPFCSQYEDGQVAACIKAFDLAIEKATADLTADASFRGAFADQLLADVRNIPDVVTDYNTDAYGNSHRYLDPIKNADGSLFTYEGTNASVCAKPDAYGSEDERATYRNGRELWWYSCNEPRYPYPSYHIDDSMTSTIAFEWMMAEYDIVGNLYWSVNYHVGEDGADLKDPYDVAHRGSGANGEGAIIYPGKQYGVDGPVASIRLDAIRDGYEDYELFQMIKSEYAFRGEDSSAVIKEITKNVYQESSVTGDASEYEAARELLLQTAESLNTITFLGGSIRLPEEYDMHADPKEKEDALKKADLRFGYLVTLPEGKTIDELNWYWEWKVDGSTSRTQIVDGVNYIALGDNTYRTNLLIAGIPMDTDYGTRICAVLKLSWQGAEDIEITDEARVRSVQEVAVKIKAEADAGTATETTQMVDYVTTLIAWKARAGETDDNGSKW